MAAASDSGQHGVVHGSAYDRIIDAVRLCGARSGYVKGRLLHDQSALSGWVLIGIGFFVFYPLGALSKGKRTGFSCLLLAD